MAAVAVAAVAVTIPVMAAAGAQSTSGAAGGAGSWVTAWGASPVVGSAIPGSTCPTGVGLTNQTVRNVVFLSAGGAEVRIRLSNAFGTQAMQVGHASVAVQGSGASAVPGTATICRPWRSEMRPKTTRESSTEIETSA